MILVLCGTQKQDFSRMINTVSQLADEEEIIVQGGHNHYNNKKIKVYGFIPAKELERLYEEADFIITHAGAASMIQALKKGKVTIAFPRLHKYGEHVNDHQLELSEKLERLGYLLVCRDEDDFRKVFEKAKTFIPKPYALKGQLVNMIDQKIENILSC